MADLARTTWTHVPERPIVLVPVGSTEQHGPHLPLDTDTTIAVAVAKRVARQLQEQHRGATVLVAPAVGYGASGEHQDFPGTMSIGTEALRMLLLELVRSLSTWAGRVVFVNAHGGNLQALVSAVTQLVHEGHDVAWAPCATEAVDAHAGYTETSLMLNLAPGLVDLSVAQPGNVTPIEELLPSLIAQGVRAVSPNGVLGDPALANAEEGSRVLGWIVDDVVDRVRGGRRDRQGRLSPGIDATVAG